MRITQRTISRNYKRQLNTVMTKRASTMEKGQSGLAFNRLSDNVAAGVRAMKVQEERLTSERQLRFYSLQIHNMPENSCLEARITRKRHLPMTALASSVSMVFLLRISVMMKRVRPIIMWRRGQSLRTTHMMTVRELCRAVKTSMSISVWDSK